MNHKQTPFAHHLLNIYYHLLNIDKVYEYGFVYLNIDFNNTYITVQHFMVQLRYLSVVMIILHTSPRLLIRYNARHEALTLCPIIIGLISYVTDPKPNRKACIQLLRLLLNFIISGIKKGRNIECSSQNY